MIKNSIKKVLVASRIRAVAALAFALIVQAALVAHAEDVVGVVQVGPTTNDVTTAQMPFTPMGEGYPADFISGLFMGDGSPLSDRLYVYSLATGLMTNAIYSAYGWLDLATLSNSLMTAARGDTIHFARTDADSVAFHLFGRPGAAASSCPRFLSLYVDPEGAFADFEVETGGRPVDLLSAYADSPNPPSLGWSHVARDVSYAQTLAFRDELPESFSAKYYLAADASLDSDGDGVPDALESRVYGTSPFEVDTDGDGIPDGVELAWGTDPLAVAPASATLLSETFEQPGVAPGPIDGQNGWTTHSGRAEAVASSPHGGSAALEMSDCADDEPASVSHDFAPSGCDVVWFDMWLVASDVDPVSPSPEEAVVIGFDNCLHPVLSDGASVVTNTSASAVEDAWTRCSVRIDYRGRTWDFYLDGVLVNSGLAIGAAAVRPTRLSLVGHGGKADDIYVGTERPLGLSSDGDSIPDEWEFAAFGSLGRDGSGDFDGDGLADRAEYGLGTNPLATDTDGDGMTDGWEVSHGLLPLDPSDASSDPDGDGLANSLEFALGTDPTFSEPDPRLALSGLRAVFLYTEGGLSGLPDYTSLVPFFAMSVDGVDWPATPWPRAVSDRGDHFATRLDGFVRIAAEGVYTFYTTADDGVELSIDGIPVVSDTSVHSARERSGSVSLAPGWHRIAVRHYENEGGEALSVSWSGPGIAKSILSGDDLLHYPENLPPTVLLSADGSVPVAGGDMRLAANAFDPDGEVVSVAIMEGDETLASASGASVVAEWTGATSGTHVYRAVATDSDGLNSETTLEYTVEPAPEGYALGLASAFYSTTNSIAFVPSGFTGWKRNGANVVKTVDYPATRGAWPGMTVSDRFCAVFTGALYVREAGAYELHLASDDGAFLSVDGMMVVDNSGIHSMKTGSVTIPLSRGLHAMELKYFENDGDAGLVFAWTPPSGAKTAVPPECLFHAVGVSLDSDSDGMPDWWEDLYGLDGHSSSDAALDPDGDGLSNLAEYRAGTDPHSADSDGDGMPDLWETANGTIPFLADAIEDLDGDGLVNVEEFRHGTNPIVADTDGDGASDYAELRNTRGNPLVSDIYWTPVVAGTAVAGASFSASTGTWRTDAEGVAYAAERAGSLSWRLDVPHGGADALAVRVGQHNFYAKTDSFDLSLFVDGLFVARQVVSAPYGTSEDAYFFLPEIPAGEHEFRLVWHNWEVNTFLAVYDLRFVSFGGPDADGDGVADWKEHRADEATDIADLPLESLVSPLCVEGRDLWRDVLEVEVAYPGTNATFATVKTIGDGFYADIPLAEDGVATISLRDRSLAGSFNVAWKPFDVFAEDYTTNALVIRTGDALKIAPYESAESEVSISVADGTNGWTAVTNWTESAATPYVFEAEGLYLVSVAHEGLVFGDAAYALVEVVRSRFPKRNPAILMDGDETLFCPELSPRNLIEHDSELQLSAEVSGEGVKLSLLTHADRDLGLVSRLDDGGAISDAVQVTPVWADNGTYYRVAETYPDGSQLVDVSLLLGAVPEGTTVNLEIFVSGVTFDDGTRNKTLTADDFDANGHITLRFIKARGVTTSVCHSTKIYQNGTLIYKNR